jgi:hypothetical protein
MINIYTLIFLLILIIFFIWVLKKKINIEDFGQFLWMPTRNTRLMSYDLRGDPAGLMIYPPYYSYNAPFATYLYRSDRYDIDGRYFVAKNNPIENQALYENDNKKRLFFNVSPFASGRYIYKTRKD